jgi:hypothetical protein
MRGLGSPDRHRFAAALAVIVLVAWTQLFLGVHELSHLGQRDASACRFALVASTVGGGEAPAALVFFAPADSAPEHAPLLTRPHSGRVVTRHARAPPALA